jgi:hypothetical protein
MHEGQHKLRIAIKRLRYATEFFASLFDHPERQKRFDKTLNDLQDGKLNDMTVTPTARIALLIRERLSKQKRRYALCFLTGRENAQLKVRRIWENVGCQFVSLRQRSAKRASPSDETRLFKPCETGDRLSDPGPVPRESRTVTGREFHARRP